LDGDAGGGIARDDWSLGSEFSIASTHCFVYHLSPNYFTRAVLKAAMHPTRSALLGLFFLLIASPCHGQNPSASPPTPAAPVVAIPSYPDTPRGREQLLGEMMKFTKANDNQTLAAYAKSLPAAAVQASAQSAPEGQSSAQETQARDVWTDPSTGLMWTGRDNGKDISWKHAIKYCRDLRLAGYSDWRLPNMAELQPIYDRTANAPGLAGPRKKPRPFSSHVKGNLFLTGIRWSSNYREDDRGRYSGYAYYFDFNSGKPDNDEGGYSDGKRALCVRGSKN
jgi:hypothetical protein